ncbi:hypothetical protein [Halosimplex amylolyticum]|uniref:hypothetical protein n=1 Tax=Halosimplex amylolyticum TaxID=3396616 RepID=UPI003F552E2D
MSTPEKSDDPDDVDFATAPEGLNDGPPADHEGWISNVEMTGPSVTVTRQSIRHCHVCDAEIYVGREEYVKAVVILHWDLGDYVTKRFPRLKFCSWDWWQEWASQ